MKLDSRPALCVLSLPRHSFLLLETKRGGNYSKCGLLRRQAFVRSTLTVWKSGAILVWAPAKLCSWLDLWPFSSLGFSGDKGEQEASSIWTSSCSSSPSDPNSVQWGPKKKRPHETFPPALLSDTEQYLCSKHAPAHPQLSLEQGNENDLNVTWQSSCCTCFWKELCIYHAESSWSISRNEMQIGENSLSEFTLFSCNPSVLPATTGV